jgi:predicted nucleic acid-binding protein
MLHIADGTIVAASTEARSEEYDGDVCEIAYLDICCFKRPFDDATIERIRREAEAVAAIVDMARAGALRLVRSPAHDFENERNPREDRRLATRLWLETATVSVAASQAASDRARALAALGFGPLDALHLAFAEASAARWFVTADDRLLRAAMRHREQLRVEVVMPEQVPLQARGDHE